MNEVTWRGGNAAIGLRMTIILIGRCIMQSNTIRKALAVAYGGVLLAACNDETTSPPRAATQPVSANAAVGDPLPTPFGIQAPLDAFFINQAPEMMIRTNDRRDFAVQRLVTAPNEGVPGGWHTHPGPSFGIVERGHVRITRYTKKDGCVSTTYGPQEAYFEVANEVHRAEVLQPDVAVEYKARFYIPVGGKFSTPAEDPCS